MASATRLCYSKSEAEVTALTSPGPGRSVQKGFSGDPHFLPSLNPTPRIPPFLFFSLRNKLVTTVEPPDPQAAGLPTRPGTVATKGVYRTPGVVQRMSGPGGVKYQARQNHTDHGEVPGALGVKVRMNSQADLRLNVGFRIMDQLFPFTSSHWHPLPLLPPGDR